METSSSLANLLPTLRSLTTSARIYLMERLDIGNIKEIFPCVVDIENLTEVEDAKEATTKDVEEEHDKKRK